MSKCSWPFGLLLEKLEILYHRFKKSSTSAFKMVPIQSASVLAVSPKCQPKGIQVSCTGLLQTYACVIDSCICPLASLTLGIVGAYSYCYGMADMHLCQVLVTEDKWVVQQSSVFTYDYLFITVPLSSFPVPAEVSWHGFGISWAEQPFSSLVQPLCNQARSDRKYFSHLWHWHYVILSFYYLFFSFLCVILGSNTKNCHAFHVQTILQLAFAGYSVKTLSWQYI